MIWIFFQKNCQVVWNSEHFPIFPLTESETVYSAFFYFFALLWSYFPTCAVVHVHSPRVAHVCTYNAHNNNNSNNSGESGEESEKLIQ